MKNSKKTTKKNCCTKMLVSALNTTLFICANTNSSIMAYQRTAPNELNKFRKIR